MSASSISNSYPTVLPFHLFPPHSYRMRRLLLSTPTDTAAPPRADSHNATADPYAGHYNFDANVVMVLSVLFCALVCFLGLNFLIRCAGRCLGLGRGGGRGGAAASTGGIKKAALKTFTTFNYSAAELKVQPRLDTECVICLSEFVAGERVRILPTCNHGFHVRCIDKWLNSHSSCPTCRHCLLKTCHKIVGQPGSSVPPPPPPPEIIVSIIAPLEPEALVRSYQL
ncbi:RING-H2 finger protein ATL78-like [Diospyros lotus]|uniref:RING-H2 finger protein ATL78-like n=1 Tax=Diospyros lotus TaxID=55363 RepID=UPI002257F96F|nr:RING-H2 finger protein ATL78-like [Diospyros lotus]